MMAKPIVGIDIGTADLKLALFAGGRITKMITEPVAGHGMGSADSLPEIARLIKRIMEREGFRVRRCGMILPMSTVFTRTVTMPMAAQEHIMVNLPYEFRDYITQENDKYFFDYAVTETIHDLDGTPSQLSMIAAATLKETIEAYSLAMRIAGLKLVTAIPEETGYLNMLRLNKDVQGGDNEAVCFIDLGHTSTRLHIFHGEQLLASRMIEKGMELVDAEISNHYGVSVEIAQEYKHENSGGAQSLEQCRQIYTDISVEVMRAINFFQFNHSNINLSRVILCGGGTHIDSLISQMASSVNIPVLKADEVFSGMDPMCIGAIGVAVQ